ncbi:MAG: iron ABC transporter permease [Acidobacteriota bacterium]
MAEALTLSPPTSRLHAWILRAWQTPAIVIGLASIVPLALLLASPMVHVLREAFSYQENEALRAGVPEGTLTLEFVREVVASNLSPKLFWIPLGNTLVTGVIATMLAVMIGGAFAWLLTRTDIPGKKVLANIALIPYVTPPWPIALAWVAAFQTDAVPGGKPGIVQWLTGMKPPSWACYGPFPIIMVEAIHLYAYAFLSISAALQRVDASLEEASDVLGVSRARTLGKITMPLALPAILSAAILTFGKAAGNFSTPFFVGNPVGYHTLATWLYALVQNQQNGRAAIIALALVLLSAVTLELNRRAVGQARKYGTVTGKGFRAQRVKLRHLRVPVTAMTTLLVLATAVVPLGILIVQSLSAEEGIYALSNLTLHSWIGHSDVRYARGEPGILRNAEMWMATWNSVKMSVLQAGICVLVGLPLALVIHEGKPAWLTRLVEILTFVPYMTPALAFGAVYLLLFARPIGPIPALYGTFTLLIVVSVAKHIPYAVRAETAALTQVAGELVDAAKIMDIPLALTMRKILIPLLRPSMFAAFVMMLISGMKELSLVILLVGPNTQLLTTFVYRYQELGHRGFSAAMVVFLVAIVVTISTVVRRLQGEDLAKGQFSEE